MKYLFLTIMCLFFGCGQEGSGGGSNSVPNSVSLSALNGTWKLSQFHCFDSTLATQTYSSLKTNFHEHTLVISGSNLDQTVEVPGCIVTSKGTLSYTDLSMSLSSLTVQSASDGQCSISYSMPVNITPNAMFMTLAPGNSISGFTNARYKSNSTRLWIPNGYSNGTAGDLCFDVYDKQ